MAIRLPMRGLLSRLARPLAAARRRVFGSRGAAAGPVAGEGASPILENKLVEDGFTLALQEMLEEDSGRFQTKLQIVSLVEFREAVGTKWARISDKVMLIAEGIINHYLGQGNTFGRQGHDFFVLVFRTVGPQEARRRALLIAQELGTRLLGDQFSSMERPLALAAEVSLTEGLNPDGSLNQAALHYAIGEMRAMLSDQSEARQTRLSLLPGTREEEDLPIRHSMLPSGQEETGPQAPRRHMEPGELPASEEPKPLRRHLLPGEMPRSDEPGLSHSMLPGDLPRQQPIPVRNQRGVVVALTGAGGREPPPKADPGWRAMGEGRPKPKDEPAWQALQVQRAAAAPEDVAPPMPPGAVTTVRWRPTWLGAGETIGAYKAHVMRADAEGVPVLEGCRAYPPGGGSSAHMLDRAAVLGTVREMRAADSATPRPMLIVPVHWASAGTTQRLSLTAPLADITEASRNTRLILELFGVPADVAQRDLAATIATLRGLCREVMLRVSLDAPNGELARDCGVSSIGIDLSELPAAQRTDDTHLLEGLKSLREAGNWCRLNTYVWGVRRRAVVVGAVALGFSMINGPGLMKDLPRPAKVLPAPRERFLIPPPARE